MKVHNESLVGLPQWHLACSYCVCCGLDLLKMFQEFFQICSDKALQMLLHGESRMSCFQSKFQFFCLVNLLIKQMRLLFGMERSVIASSPTERTLERSSFQQSRSKAETSYLGFAREIFWAFILRSPAGLGSQESVNKPLSCKSYRTLR